jgi:hypothetical protein
MFSSYSHNLQNFDSNFQQMQTFKNSNLWQQMQKYVTFELMTNSLQLKTNTFILDLMHHMVEREAKWPWGTRPP